MYIEEKNVHLKGSGQTPCGAIINSPPHNYNLKVVRKDSGFGQANVGAGGHGMAVEGGEGDLVKVNQAKAPHPCTEQHVRCMATNTLMVCDGEHCQACHNNTLHHACHHHAPLGPPRQPNCQRSAAVPPLQKTEYCV